MVGKFHQPPTCSSAAFHVATLTRSEHEGYELENIGKAIIIGPYT
jgi:hypothetical protein